MIITMKITTQVRDKSTVMLRKREKSNDNNDSSGAKGPSLFANCPTTPSLCGYIYVDDNVLFLF